MTNRSKTILTNFFLTKEDREVLTGICEQDGLHGMSNAVRRLIREEGRRRGLLPPTDAPLPDAPDRLAAQAAP